MVENMSGMTERETIETDLLLEALYRISGFDFRLYMRSSIQRRIQHRMHKDHFSTITALTEQVIHDDMYANKLIDDFSINVTDMFRDPDFFLSFRKNVVPKLREYPTIRIWHAGCSTGEEVYSMAILMEEEGLGDKVKIYATDMNEKIVKKAEEGAFPLKKMQAYTTNYLKAGGTRAFSEYYTTDSQNAYFSKLLSKNIVFAQHNLVTDRSFNEFHVIICRNVLIYFTLDLQIKVCTLFNDSLSKYGFLGLGSKESLKVMEHMDGFEEFDCKEKIYQKKY